MAVHLLSGSFNAGLLSPEMDARVNVEKYESGCRILKNFLPTVPGPIIRRPGTQFLGYASSDTIVPRLIGFQFANSNVTAEMCVGQFCFWKDGAPVLTSGGSRFTVAHPYQETELFEVQFRQVNDVIYLTHFNHEPKVLLHYADDNWKLRDIHEPDAGWEPGGTPTNSTPVTGNAILERFVASWGTTRAQMVAWVAAHAATATVNNSAAPAGTGTSFSAAIQRVKGWFVPSTTGNYRFRLRNIDDVAQLSFETTAYGTGSGATVVVYRDTPGTHTMSTNLSLVAGSSYYIEMLLGDYSPPSGGFFDVSADAGATWTTITAAMLSGQRTGATTTPNGALSGWPALLDENVKDITIAPSGTTGAINLVASADIWTAQHVGAWWQLAHRRVTAFVEVTTTAAQATYASAGTSFTSPTSTGLKVTGKCDLTCTGIWSGTLHLEEQQPDASWKVVRSWVGAKDRNPTATFQFDQETTVRLRLDSGLAWAASTQANPRMMLEAADAKIYGLVRITAFTDAQHVAAKVYGTLWSTDATTQWTEGAWSTYQGFPRTMTLHEQRTIWAGTARQPQSIWASFLGDFENFRRTSIDDASWLRQLASENAHVIQWMISQNTLMIGTSRGIWLGESPADGILTPLAGKFTPRTSATCAYRQALLVNESVLFLQTNMQGIRRLSYQDTTNQVSSSDLTTLAGNIAAGGIRQAVWQSQNRSVVWMVANDGRLLGLTLEEDQNVFAWHEHTTQGEFLSVSQTPGLLTDEITVAVRRLKSDGTPKICIERFNPTAFAAGSAVHQEVYLDGAISLGDGTAVSTFDLSATAPHLAGMEVRAWGQQIGTHNSSTYIAYRDLGTVTFDAATVLTLPSAVKYLTIGFPFTSQVQKMKPEIPVQDGTGQARRIIANRVTLRLLNSRGGAVLGSATEREEPLQYDIPGDWITHGFYYHSGDKDIVLETRNKESIDTIVQTSELYPFNLVAIIYKSDSYGN